MRFGWDRRIVGRPVESAGVTRRQFGQGHDGRRQNPQQSRQRWSEYQRIRVFWRQRWAQTRSGPNHDYLRVSGRWVACKIRWMSSLTLCSMFRRCTRYASQDTREIYPWEISRYIMQILCPVRSEERFIALIKNKIYVKENENGDTDLMNAIWTLGNLPRSVLSKFLGDKFPSKCKVIDE